MIEDASDLSSIKLIDFGLSVKYDDTSFSNTLNDRWGTVIFMAPEILMYKDYSKSVDMWSIGILMYMLISGGKHPFYKSGMNLDQYWEVLKKSPKVTFDDEKFSKISQDLITKFLQFETIHRYSVYQALKHPWITRWNESCIPETFDQMIKNLETEDKLRYVMKLSFALSVIKSPTVVVDTPSPKYVQLLGKVTNVIDKWQETKQRTDFVNDEDFVERQGSPSKFDTVSNFSQAFNDWEDGLRDDLSYSSDGLSPNISGDEFNPSPWK
jgi:serine/threonine protein kinase